MTGRLAVVTSQLGTPSETFIRRHVEDLAPGCTVTVARHTVARAAWTVSAPTFCIDRWTSRLEVRLARRIGASEGVLRDAAVSRFLRRHGVSVVLGEYLDQFVDFVPALERLCLPYVVQGHGIDLSAALRRPGMAERYRAYASAAAVLTRCDVHRRRLIGLGLPPSKIHVSPGGIDIPETMPVRDAGAHQRFLAVGRLVPKKGPMYLLEAFRVAAASNPRLSLDLIGDGPLLPAAKQFVEATGLTRSVRLRGAASESVKSRLLAECGVFVQHSLTDPETGDEEGLPAAIQEAMANGLAVISTRHAGIPEAVTDGVSGILVEERDARGMSDAMQRVAASTDLALSLGAAGRIRAVADYSWPDERSRLLSHLLNN